MQRFSHEFSSLVIEGQPQRQCPAPTSWQEFSSLVIEGQPQREASLSALSPKFSSLVIEGQPQLVHPDIDMQPSLAVW